MDYATQRIEELAREHARSLPELTRPHHDRGTMSTDLFEQKQPVALTVREDDAIRPELVEYDPTLIGTAMTFESSPTTLQQADPYYGAGDLDLTDKQRDILLRAFDPRELDILPTGEVYAPQVQYRRRLNEAFGIGRWSLRPLAEPKVSGKTVVRWYALYVNGKFASETFGESDFIENNPRFTWGTALESAKSNALMRCCKDIGVNLECWDKEWTRNWKHRFARQIEGKWQKVSGMDAGGVGNTSASAAQSSGSHPITLSQASSSNPSEPADPPASSSTKVIRPTKFDGKNWRLKDGTPCMYLIDDEGTKWTVSGAKNLELAENGILSNKPVKVTYRRNGKYLNVSAVEPVNG